MKAQTPAQGVLKSHEWGYSKTYKVVCGCGDDDCTHNVDVEADDAGVTVTVYTRTRTNFWTKTRWHHIWSLLTKGYADFETSIVMDKQVAFNYSDVLKSAVKDVEEFRKEHNVKT